MPQVATKKSWFEAQVPEMAEAWNNFLDTVYDESELDRKSKELIAAATSTVNRCPHCTKGHIKKAKEFGASEEEISEAFMITALISSGTEIHWMLEDYEELLGSGNGQSDRWFQQNTASMGDEWKTFHDALQEDSTLDKKTKELVAVAVAETRRCRHCTKAHIKGAQQAGASQAEVSEAIMIAALIASGTQLAWMKEDYEELLGG